MDRLTDPNPYDILGIRPDADRAAIKRALAEKQRKNRSQADRQQALKARNTLFSTEKRLVADALVPDFASAAEQEQHGIERMIESVAPFDWREIADPDAIMMQDMQAIIEATLRHTLGTITTSAHQVAFTTAFDGLDEFLEEWGV
jgi:hypothetical protein